MFGINQLQKNIKYQINKQSKKIRELKYGNTKLLGNTKYNQVVFAYNIKLVFAFFVFFFLCLVGIKLY